MNTETLASKLGLKPHTLRASFCRSGAYYGVVPQKWPNGKLDWPDDSIERLKGHVATDSHPESRAA